MYDGCTIRKTWNSGTARRLRIAQAMLGLGLPLSNEGMRSLNKIEGFKRTQGTETSQYLEERTSTETPLVVASERGPGQSYDCCNQKCLEKKAVGGDRAVW